MTANDFRKCALRLPGTEEQSHMDHPDFRAGGKIFATLPVPGRGMVKLTPEQQWTFVHDEPDAFQPVPGGWGRRGATHVILKAVKRPALERALLTAWRNHAPKSLAGPYEPSPAG